MDISLEDEGFANLVKQLTTAARRFKAWQSAPRSLRPPARLSHTAGGSIEPQRGHNLDAEREARRAAGVPDPVIGEATPPMPVDLDQVYQTADKLRRMLACFDEGRERWISFALEGIRAKEPETFQYDEEPFDYVGRHALFDGRNLVNVPRQKKPAHRPRNPRVGDRKIQVVETYQQLRTNPALKVAEIHQHLATMFCIGVSYVKRILREARKVGAL
jgi:hypothetical protein